MRRAPLARRPYRVWSRVAERASFSYTTDPPPPTRRVTPQRTRPDKRGDLEVDERSSRLVRMIETTVVALERKPPRNVPRSCQRRNGNDDETQRTGPPTNSDLV